MRNKRGGGRKSPRKRAGAWVRLCYGGKGPPSTDGLGLWAAKAGAEAQTRGVYSGLSRCLCSPLQTPEGETGGAGADLRRGAVLGASGGVGEKGLDISGGLS